MSGVLNVLLGDNAASGGAAYVGPGDVVSGALAWVGLRAYSDATKGGNCCDIQRASDTTTNTFVTLSDGTLDVASITTFLTSTTGFVSKLYDQTGNGFDCITIGGHNQFILSALGSRPAIRAAGSLDAVLRSSGSITQAQPYTISAVAKRTGNFTTTGGIASIGAGGIIRFTGSVNQILVYAGSSLNATASDSNPHSINAVYNGASSDANVDGSANTGNAGTGTNGLFTVVSDGFGDFLTGDWFESGAWGVGFTGTQSSNMSANQHTYWGF